VGLGYGLIRERCECDNKPSASIKCEEFLAWLRTG
jgi:hypothetical protein